MSTATATPEASAAEVPAKKSKKKLIIIVVAVLALAGGGWFMFLKPKGPPPPPAPGAVVKLDAVTLNLSKGHFLKLGLALQATTTAKEPPEGSKALDIAISTFSDKDPAELSSNEARETIKEALVKQVEKAYEGDVMDVYFTEFVMQ